MPRSSSSRARTSPRTCGIRTAARRLDRPKERVQLVEMELADVVDGFAIDGEQQPSGTHARPVAVGTA
jgi:hypothetical protein